MRDFLLTEEPARRGFLRNLIMAPAAALATHRLIVPARTIVQPEDDALARLHRHVAGVESAMRDIFPGTKVRSWGNCLKGGHEYYRASFERGDPGAVACVGFDASLLPALDRGAQP